MEALAIILLATAGILAVFVLLDYGQETWGKIKRPILHSNKQGGAQ